MNEENEYALLTTDQDTKLKALSLRIQANDREKDDIHGEVMDVLGCYVDDYCVMQAAQEFEQHGKDSLNWGCSDLDDPNYFSIIGDEALKFWRCMELAHELDELSVQKPTPFFESQVSDHLQVE